MTKSISFFGFVKGLIRRFWRAIFLALGGKLKVAGCVSESWESLETYTEAQNIAYKPFGEFHKLTLPTAICLAGKDVEAMRAFDSSSESVVLELAGKGAYFAHNHLLDASHRVIYHPEMLFKQLPIRKAERPFFVKKLKGTIAYLSNTAATHYGHWLRLTLPLLKLYEREVGLEAIDYFYVGDVPIQPFMRESFELLGLPASKIVNFPCKGARVLIALKRWDLQKNKRVFPKTLVQPKTENGYRYLDLLDYSFVRERVGKVVFETPATCQNCYPRLAYIARGRVAWRRVTNEPEVWALMQKYGFECRVMDSLPMTEQMRIFQNADFIVAPHGAALTNLFFAKPQARILEILPQGYPDYTNYTLAALSQCQYFYIQAPTPPNQAHLAPEYRDMEIDLAVLEQALQTILAV